MTTKDFLFIIIYMLEIEIIKAEGISLTED